MSARDERILGDYLTAEISDHYTDKYGPESGERVRKALSADAAPLPPEREREIRHRAAAATPGPWHLEHSPDSYGCVTIGDYGWVAPGPATPEYDVDSDQGRSDAEFIAHAREDLPALLAEVDRLRTELAGRPTEGHVLRQAAAALEEDDHLAAAAELLEMANQREHTALRPWKTDAAEAGVDIPVGGESTRTGDVPDKDNDEEFPSGGSLIRHPSHAPTRSYLAANPLPTQKGTA